MLSVFDRDRRLQRVIFGTNTYLVPRQDGTIVIGATVEDVGFTEGNTAAGIMQLLGNAISLYPAIANLTIQSTWWGFRPFAPNEMPILGASSYENLCLATGHYRNGILLAPITARFLADRLEGKAIDPLMGEFRLQP
jgi:glycine/D-amino acid oxidase-like deaminating enzyme